MYRIQFQKIVCQGYLKTDLFYKLFVNSINNNSNKSRVSIKFYKFISFTAQINFQNSNKPIKCIGYNFKR